MTFGSPYFIIRVTLFKGGAKLNTGKKRGPKTDNPKPYRMAVKYDEECKEILEAYCEQENVRFIGGKLRIDLASEEVLNLTADFYFYTHEETWSVQHKEGSLKVDAIIDWEDNPDLSELRGEGYLEYPLEPPESSNPCKK